MKVKVIKDIIRLSFLPNGKQPPYYKLTGNEFEICKISDNKDGKLSIILPIELHNEFGNGIQWLNKGEYEIIED